MQIFAKCAICIDWAEHEDFDPLEFSETLKDLQSVLLTNSIDWTRPLKHVYWEAGDLDHYDYILYAGREFERAQAFHAQSSKIYELAKGIGFKQRHATMINLGSYISKKKWPYAKEDMELTWIGEPTPRTRLQRQFEVLRDCCDELIWHLFQVALPGSDHDLQVTDGTDSLPPPQEFPAPLLQALSEMSGEREAVELNAPHSQVLSKLSSEREAVELEGSSVTAENAAEILSRARFLSPEE